MKNLILGNGINIQFGGIDYINKSIIKRGIQNIRSGNYSTDVYSDDVLKWIRKLHSFLPIFLSGGFDKYTLQQDEIEGLVSIKKRYNKNTKIYGIGFEDYFLMNDLACRYSKIENLTRFYAQEFMKRFFLDSIYNNGEVNCIWENYSDNFVKFLKRYDNIFTTNYDNNLEQIIDNRVIHLHGDYKTLSFVYDPMSFRNHLSDKPAIETPVVVGYEYLFSTAITYSSSKLKNFVITQNTRTNSFLEKSVKALKDKPKLEEKLLKFKDSDLEPVRKIYEAIKIKQSNPELEFEDEYKWESFENIEGEISYLGLSPYNDTHLFKAINNNKNIEKVIFYYYSENEKRDVKTLFSQKKVDIIPVATFWSKV